MYYIQEIDKPNRIKKMFNIVKVQKDKIILPIIEEDIKIEKAEKMVKKTVNILKKAGTETVVLSKRINKQNDYINFLYSYGIKIIEGRWLFKALTLKVLDYITEKKRLKKEDIQISILINDVELNMLENIKQIARQYKAVNIVTNHFEKFKKIEQQILEEEGIMITITNNKRKSLHKSDIILNVDFPSELINKYEIYEEAIIVNLKGEVLISSKRFNGITIIDYEIEFENPDKLDYEKDVLYDKKNIYESLIYQNRTFEYLQDKFIKDKVRIKYLKCNKSIL